MTDNMDSKDQDERSDEHREDGRKDDERREHRWRTRREYGDDCKEPRDDDQRRNWEEVLDRYRREWRELDNDDRSWSPWLVIRYTAADIGLRPIPSTQAHYLSPDIWIESSDPLGRGVAGEDNFVHARVFNLGKADAFPTRVDFYWADPSLGLGPGNMNLIGTEWVDFKAHQASDVRCNTPWVPEFLNDGHECLMVNCTSPILDPIAHPFHPRLDRHVGQRNITVVEAQDHDTFTMTVLVNNLLPFEARATVTARVRLLWIDPTAGDFLPAHAVVAAAAGFGQPDAVTPELVLRQFKERTDMRRRARSAAKFLAKVRPEPLRSPFVHGRDPNKHSAASIDAEWTGEAGIVTPDTPGTYGGQLMVGLDDLAAADAVADARAAVIAGDTFQPFEQRPLEVRVGMPRDSNDEDLVAAELNHWVGGYHLGGYTVLGTRGVPSWAHRSFAR